MTANLFIGSKFATTSSAGTPLAGGKVYTYAAGTLTPLATYTDYGGASPNANPVILDANGRANIWLGNAAYRFIIKDAADVLAPDGDVDNILPSSYYTDTRIAALLAQLLAQLADFTSAANGPGLIGFTWTLNYAVGTIGWAVKAGAKNLNAFVGVDPTGAADSTATIQAVLNMGGSCFGTGTYKLTSALTMSVAGTYYVGSGLTSNLLYQQTLGAKIFNVTADNCGVSGVMLDYNGTPTAGATAIYSAGSNTEFHSFKVNRAYIGLQLITGNSQQAHHFQIYNTVSIGVWATETGDAFIDTFIIDAISTTNNALGGLRLENFCEAAQISNGDILNGAYSIVTDAASYVAGSRPAYCTFTSVYGDTSVNGSRIDKAALLTFNQCWISAGRSGAGFPGCSLIQTEGIVFSATKFVNCGSHGLYVGTNAANTILNACQALGNSVTAGAGVAHGVLVDVNNDGLQINGGKYSNSFFAGSQAYGIAISAGCTNYTYIGADCRSNATGSIFDGANAATGIISKCKGFVTQNKGTAAVAVGTAAIVVNHGLAGTPAGTDITISDISSRNASAVGSVWLSTYTATQFTINTNVNVTTTPMSVAWQASIKGE